MDSFLIRVFFLFITHILWASPQFIFISGESASGKTTFARALLERLGEERALVISLDMYLDKRVQPKEYFIDGMPNFEHPSMVHWALLLDHFSLLQRGGSFDIPIYDFSFWMPLGSRPVTWRPIVIVEGIHALQDELDHISGLRIFLRVPEDLQWGRRLDRDIKERGYSKEQSEQIFRSIALPYQKLFVEPTHRKAHFIMDHFDSLEYLKQAVNYVVDLIDQETTKDCDQSPITLRYDGERLK